MANIQVKYSIVEPVPSSLIESMRAFGYSPETSIADLVDNSISARCNNIWIQFNWLGINSFISITDDGLGMEEQQLNDAMRLGSQNPLDTRDEHDLGRFGLGLKTASFAQCRKLTVASSVNNKDRNVRCWDLDYVISNGEWRLQHNSSNQVTDLIDSEFTKIKKHGTIVVWDNLDRLMGTAEKEDEKAEIEFYQIKDNIAKHLSMVFHRYINGPEKLKIFVGNDPEPLTDWDPFMTNNSFTQPKEPEHPEINGEKIHITPYILPHYTKMSSEQHENSSGIKGWNAHQGFYLYRNKRMIVDGSWMGIKKLKQEEHTKLARIQLDIPNSLDTEWELDVKKSDARPPASLREELERIATATRNAAEDVYRHRSKPVKPQNGTGQFIQIWKQRRLRGDKLKYSLDRNHPLIKNLKQKTKDSNLLESVFNLVEETVPVNQMALDIARKEDSHSLEYESYTGSALMNDIDHIYRIQYEHFKDHKKTIDLIALMYPFNKYPEYISILEERYGDSK